jgi:hypothetical protein
VTSKSFEKLDVVGLAVVWTDEDVVFLVELEVFLLELLLEVLVLVLAVCQGSSRGKIIERTERVAVVVKSFDQVEEEDAEDDEVVVEVDVEVEVL